MSNNPTFIPHIVVSNAAAAIDFYKSAFGAVEVARHCAPNSNKIMHAALQINGGMLMLNDDFSESMNCKRETPETLGGSPVVFNLQVENADAAWDQALAAGATIKFPLANQFWGDRYGQVTDPFGHYWAICQTISKPTAEEVEEGAKAAFAD